jgi:hypothetical protein
MAEEAAQKAVTRANELSAEVTTLQGEVRTKKEQTKAISRKLDILRRLVQVATAVVIALLFILWFIQHPALSPSTKQPVLGALFIVCAAYIVALELARGSAGVVIFLLATGNTITMLSLGYTLCRMHEYLF